MPKTSATFMFFVRRTLVASTILIAVALPAGTHAPWPASAHVEQPKLLSNQEVQHFIKESFVRIRTELPRTFHDQLFKETRELHAKETNPGNNILPRISALHDILSDRCVVGALQSLLGKDFYLHPHRHVHESFPGKEQQPLHQDTHWDYVQARHHHPQWAMAYYYPQDTTLELGATAIIPGSQYFDRQHAYASVNEYDEEPKILEVVAGDVVIVAYDVFHAGLHNSLGELIPGTAFSNARRAEEENRVKISRDPAKYRYMFKFQFVRMRQPGVRPISWAITAGHSGIAQWPLHERRQSMHAPVIWNSIWRWMFGSFGSDLTNETSANERTIPTSLSKEQKALSGKDTKRRMVAAYMLAQSGDEASHEILLQSMLSPKAGGRDFAIAEAAMHGVVAVGPRVLTQLIPAIRSVLQADRQDPRRKYLHFACFALGEILSSGPLPAASVDNRTCVANAIARSTSSADRSCGIGADSLLNAVQLIIDITSDPVSTPLAIRDAIEALGMVGARVADDLEDSTAGSPQLEQVVKLVLEKLIQILEGTAVSVPGALSHAQDMNYLNSFPSAPPRWASVQRKFQAALAIAQLRQHATPAMKLLIHVAEDKASDRYLRKNALEALHRIGTHEAWEAIVDLLPGSKISNVKAKSGMPETLQLQASRAIAETPCPWSSSNSPY